MEPYSWVDSTVCQQARKVLATAGAAGKIFAASGGHSDQPSASIGTFSGRSIVGSSSSSVVDRRSNVESIRPDHHAGINKGTAGKQEKRIDGTKPQFRSSKRDFKRTKKSRTSKQG
jgi:hypothetical protein